MEYLWIYVEVTRGTVLSKLNKEGMIEVKELGYMDILFKEQNPLLNSTINFDNMLKKKFGKINLENKYNNPLIQKHDVILPVSNIDFEPKYINWEGNENLKFIYQQKQFILRPKHNRILPKFLLYLLDTEDVKDYFRKVGKEGERYRITAKMINELQVEVPNLETQKEIVARLEIKNREEQNLRNYFNSLAKRGE